MRRRQGRRTPPGTIWEAPDALGERIEPILKDFRPRKATGPPPAQRRRTLDGVIFRMRTGCQRDRLPAEYGPESAVHGWSQRRAEGGVLGKIWAVLVAECHELRGVERKWQAADGMLGKARFGGKATGRDPTDRGKEGAEERVPTDGDGGPPAAVIAGANVPDCQPPGATIEAVVVERPDPEQVERHLCPDAGYDNPSGREAVGAGGYVGHIRPSRPGGRGKRRPGRRKPRRWVVERTLAWLSKCRGILARYEEEEGNYLGPIQLACGLYWSRRRHRMGVCDATAEIT